MPKKYKNKNLKKIVFVKKKKRKKKTFQHVSLDLSNPQGNQTRNGILILATYTV